MEGSAADGGSEGKEKPGGDAGKALTSLSLNVGEAGGMLEKLGGGETSPALSKLEAREIFPTSAVGALGLKPDPALSPVVVRFKRASQASEDDAGETGGGAASVCSG